MNKATNKELNEAMKFLNRYKSFFQLDDDDVQEIIIKFNGAYDNTKGGIKTFLKTVITNYNASKWRTAASPKYARTEIKLDDINEDDDREWLMAKIASDEADKLETKELLAEQRRVIEFALEVLTDKQRIVIEKMYFEYLNSYEIAAAMQITHQNVSLIKYRALGKMEEFLKKNNINMIF